MSFEDLSKQFGFSRATYCRKRKILKGLDEGKAPISRVSRAIMRRWGDAEIGLVLKIRRESPREVQNLSYFEERLRISDERKYRRTYS